MDSGITGNFLKITTRPQSGTDIYRCDSPLLQGGDFCTDFAEGKHGTSHATFDQTRKHRFTLGRHWGKGDAAVCFCMLNPSTADAFKLDPTVTRCYNFARKWGADGMMVINIFSLRTPSPRELKFSPYPNHVLNDLALSTSAKTFGTIVAGWGNHGSFLRREESIYALFAKLGTAVYALGSTNCNGSPKHPLYLPGDSRPFRLRS